MYPRKHLLDIESQTLKHANICRFTILKREATFCLCSVHSHVLLLETLHLLLQTHVVHGAGLDPFLQALDVICLTLTALLGRHLQTEEATAVTGSYISQLHKWL